MVGKRAGQFAAANKPFSTSHRPHTPKKNIEISEDGNGQKVTEFGDVWCESNSTLILISQDTGHQFRTRGATKKPSTLNLRKRVRSPQREGTTHGNPKRTSRSETPQRRKIGVTPTGASTEMSTKFNGLVPIFGWTGSIDLSCAESHLLQLLQPVFLLLLVPDTNKLWERSFKFQNVDKLGSLVHRESKFYSRV